MSKKSIIEKIIKSRTWIWIFELKRMIFNNLNFRAKILFYESKENIKKDMHLWFWNIVSENDWDVKKMKNYWGSLIFNFLVFRVTWLNRFVSHPNDYFCVRWHSEHELDGLCIKKLFSTLLAKKPFCNGFMRAQF